MRRTIYLCLGLFFAAMTAWVLFADVLAGAPVTPGHGLALAGLVAALASGHAALHAWHDRAWLTVAGMALLFVCATAYVIVSAGNRNAEAGEVKAAAGRSVGEQRREARARLTAAEAALVAAERHAATKAAEFERECKDGPGKFCKGSKTISEGASEVARLRKGDVREARRDLEAIKDGPVSSYAGAARVAAALGLGSEASAEARLSLAMPFVTAIITEIATILFLGAGLRAPARISTISSPEIVRKSLPETISRDGKSLEILGNRPEIVETVRSSVSKPKIVSRPRKSSEIVAGNRHPVLAALETVGRSVSNKELAEIMGISQGEASKSWREVSGQLIVERDGRELRIRTR